MENRTASKKLVLAALFTALCCVMTMVVQVPSPMNGYVNLGDCAVLLSAWILGPIYGAAAGGIGSMLADIFSGYAHYAPGTLIIKGGMAAVAALLFQMLRRGRLARFVSALAAEVMMVFGYFGYACLLLGKGLGAAASIPGNVVQGVFAIVGALALAEALCRVGLKELSVTHRQNH